MTMRPAEVLANRIAIAILAAVTITVAFTFRDYGLGWDDHTHSQYGELLLKLYSSGFADRRALSFVNLYFYGGGFDMAAALAAKISPFDLFDTRRLLGALVGLIGLIATWRLGRRLGGPIAGVSALALLAASPIYFGHMFMNPKDAPFAVAMIALLLGVVRAFDEYPRPGWRTVVLIGIALGAAFGSRILAVLAAPPAAIALLFIVGEETRTGGWKHAGSRLRRFVVRLIPALVFAYLLMAVLWPWSVLKPFNPVYAALYFDTFFEKPWKELYESVLIAVPDMPSTYLPHLLLLKLPEILLALGGVGVIATFDAATRRHIELSRRAGMLAVVLSVILPVAIAMVTRPALYNGIRQFLFIVPPLAVQGGLATGWALRRAARFGRPAVATSMAVFTAGLAVPVYGMVQLHPYEYVYFNPTGGGVRGADGRYMLDYWGLAFKQAAEELQARLAAADEKPAAGRRWIVAICGPQASAQVELGSQFETTFDQKKADFALALGTFYCQHLQSPIIGSVRRAGVVFANVYDLRGVPTPKLLTLPPP